MEVDMERTLEGRAIIVTGAGGGIGRAASLIFAGAGARVVVSDIDAASGDETVKQISNQGGTAMFVKTDITDETSVAALVARTVSAYGTLDGAFNNAGIAPSHKSFHEISRVAWNRVIDVDLTGAFLCMKHEIGAMLQTGGGSIVNTASALGVVGVPSAGDYIAAKHGVIGLTKSAAVDYGGRNIRVNAVLPGLIMTPLVSEALRDPEYASHFEKYKAQHLVGRVGLPEEVARTAEWLLSDAASFVTGHSMAVDGGWTTV
jgi:NAD(P)-dependent dehydrogenase (short-subunit alcohol dehydrogenase family)